MGCTSREVRLPPAPPAVWAGDTDRERERERGEGETHRENTEGWWWWWWKRRKKTKYDGY